MTAAPPGPPDRPVPPWICGLFRGLAWVDRLTDWVGKSLNVLVLLTIAVGFYNVAARYIGRFIGLQLASNVWLELQWYLFSMTFFLGFSYILKHNANVRVDFLYSNWRDRRKAWIDLLGTVFFLIPFCIMGLWVTLNPVLQSWGLQPDGSWGTWEISADANGLPRAPIKSFVLISFGLLLLQAIAQATKFFAIAKGYRPIPPELLPETEHPPLE